MIAIVVPEPAPWVDELVRAVRSAGHTPRIVAPPRALRLGLRAWARGRADRIIRARLALRVALDAWVALRLGDVTAVVAPTGAARRTFAIAERQGARRILVSDQPCLRQLHRDLDRAARTLPDRRFLRRYRADRAALVRQEAEWVLADAVVVRGRHAHAIHAAVVPPDRLLALPEPAPQVRAAAPGRGVLLAGLAAARMGVDAALAACAAHGWTLHVRAGEGTEPADLLARPGVVASTGFDGIGAVIAPAWCESYPHEIAAARALGIPVVATRAASGFAATREISAGDPDALAAAIAAEFEAPRPAPADRAAEREAARAALRALLEHRDRTGRERIAHG